MRLLLLLAGLLLFSLPAEARMHAPYRGHRISGMAAPLDTFATPAAAYSLRKLKSSYTGPGIKLRRVSDNATQDINYLGFSGFTGAPIDVAAAAVFCAATTCFGDTWYDQSGAGLNLTQPATASQQAFIFNCLGTMPCFRSTSAVTQWLETVSVTPAVPLTLNAVEQAAVKGTAGCNTWVQGSNSVTQHPTDVVVLSNGTASFNAADPGTAWRSITGVMAGASSVISVDGTETAGSLAPAATAGGLYFFAGAGATCNGVERIVWNGYAPSAAERAALIANQRSFWGF